MIKFSTPENPINFILVTDGDKILELHEKGFFPSYRDSKGVYFKATPEIFRILK